MKTKEEIAVINDADLLYLFGVNSYLINSQIIEEKQFAINLFEECKKRFTDSKPLEVEG